MDTAVINRATVKVPWEPLLPGPVGEYIELVDFDPASRCFYAPVDLSHPYLLAEDGMEPSEGCPQFHQQMVYAVAMTTISHFEKALGRTALWAPQITRGKDGTEKETYVPRLRIYPHALRVANAYYSPPKKALLCGYYPAAATRPGQHMPRGIVFTCLSHDIIAHETTHALLDGMNRRYLEPTNPDVLAFHEAFADIVALFQHFSMPEVLRHQIAHTRGDLASQNMLGQLAQQFGETTGRYGALRDALGKVDPKTGQWEPTQPDPTELEREFEPHARGSILVAAVFDAFLSIYKSRIADLLRIATSGSGVLPAGSLHPDLVNRLAVEASKSARHVLSICIRALDYCPPVDLTFGEYLRAIITADYDLVREDDRGYRIAFIEAFRRRGIYPLDIRTLSVESLRWQQPGIFIPEAAVTPLFDEKLVNLAKNWHLASNRRFLFEHLAAHRRSLQDWLSKILKEHPEACRVFGLDMEIPINSANADDPANQESVIEVSALRPARRIGPDGQQLVDIVIEIVQRRWETAQPPGGEGKGAAAQAKSLAGTPGGFWFRGGCTVVFDLQLRSVRYCILKDINSENRLNRQREFLTRGSMPSLQATYFGRLEQDKEGEAFAFLHATSEEMY
jgi:quinol monooxygenase YgiN